MSMNGDRLRSPFSRPSDLLWIFAGGAAGAGARVGVADLWLSIGSAEPIWATVFVNVFGTAALAFLLVSNPRRPARLAAGIGFLGSFTTFSTFAVEALNAGWGRGALYVVVSVGLGWLAVRIVGRA